jgi:hypothetical protein
MKTALTILLIFLTSSSGLAQQDKLITSTQLDLAVLHSGLMIVGRIEEASPKYFPNEMEDPRDLPIPSRARGMASQWPNIDRNNWIVTEINIEVIEVLGGEYDSTHIQVIFPEGRKNGEVMMRADHHLIEFSVGDTIAFALHYGFAGKQYWFVHWDDNALFKDNGVWNAYRGTLAGNISDPINYMRWKGPSRGVQRLCKLSNTVIIGEFVSSIPGELTIKTVRYIKGEGAGEDMKIVSYPNIHAEAGQELLLFLRCLANGNHLTETANSIYYVQNESLYRDGIIPMVSDLSDVIEYCKE